MCSSDLTGNETILIVDDEQMLLDMATAQLEVLGYKTIQANDGEMALDILKNNSDIDLVFSDVIMPGKYDGYHLALEAIKLYPQIKVLLTSGFTSDRENFVNGEHEQVKQLTERLLNKPYSNMELATAIRLTFGNGVRKP